MTNLDGDLKDAGLDSRCVARVQFHTGVQLGNVVRNSLDAIKDQVDMKMCYWGVHIVTQTHGEYIVGMPDILWVKLA